VNYRGTENLLNESLRQGVEHFIYVSSASVVYKHTTAYSRSKMRSELLIKESGINYTIIRPTLVYDFGKGSAEFDRFLDYLRAFPVIPFIGNGNAVKRPVHVDAVKRGLVSICYNERTYNKTYNFSGVQPLKMKELAAFCLILLNMRKKKIIYIPVGICRIISYIMGMIRSEPPLRWQVVAGVIQDADLDPSAAIEETGFTESDVFRDLPKCFPREG
ncbi:MAG: NAD-dependent epimerase/dehydratase family protein, partial [Chitinivibrionales bacterium]